MALPAALRGLTPYFIYLLVTATIGPLLFGYHLAELNAPQKVVSCVQKSLRSENSETARDVVIRGIDGLPQCIPMDALQFGVVTSFFTLGGLVGALLAGPLTAKQGRLRTMLITGLFAAIGPVFETLASSIAVLAIGRFLSGVGAGAATVVVPIYISEIAPPAQRGFFGSFTQVMINFGILIAQVLGLFLSRDQLWRIILATGGAIAIGQIVGLLLGGQESPKWLAENGHNGKAKKILQKIRGHSTNIESETIDWSATTERDVADEEETLLASEERIPGATDSGRKGQTLGPIAVLQHPDSRFAVVVVAIIMVAQQGLGINSIVMYGVALLSDLLASNAATLNVVVAAVNIFVTIAGAPLVDALGRKTCLLLSMTGMGVCAVLLGFGIMYAVRVLSALAVMGFVASFGLGLGPIPFILASELVNSEAVGATQSWALAANWIATFVVAQFFPVVNEMLGKGQVYFIFAAFAALFGTFTAIWVPESKGKADADEVWGRRKPQVRED